MPSQLIVVTGPEGVDIGRAVAEIGSRVDDGFAVRVVDSTRDSVAHTSPDPYHRVLTADPAVAQGPAQPGAVRLRCLPSAWQDPQTNLGVVFTRAALPLGDDIYTLAALGLDPSHRVTVDTRGGHLIRGFTYPLPIEPGNVGVQVRDAVLRAGGSAIVEAGDGMSHLEALAALRLAPWSPWIDELHLWTVFDVAAPGAGLDAEGVAAWVVDHLTRLGGTIDNEGTDPDERQVRSNVIVLGLDALGIPEADVAGSIFQRTGGAIDTVLTSLDPDILHL